MDVLLRTAVFLWISAGFLPLPEKAEACHSNVFPATCDLFVRNVCFVFVEDSKTWFEARSSCKKHGGELLRVMDSEVKSFLENNSGNRNNSSWWLGEGVQGEPAMDVAPSSDTKNTPGSSSRVRRSADDMGLHIDNITLLLQEADKELKRIEVTSGEPTDDVRDKFIDYLLKATKKLTKKFALANNDIMSNIINCSNAIYLLATKKCDLLTNPNPTSLFERIFEIFSTVSVLLSSGDEDMVIKHQSGSIYQTTRKPDELGNAVLGSEADGEFIRLPSFSALMGQFGDAASITSQMTTFSGNPHPSEDNITGTVCSLLLNNKGTEIKLVNLSESIEIYLPRPNPSSLINTTIELENNTKVHNRFNVTDANVTIIFNAVPNLNVSLILTLSYGLPPTSSYTSTIILGPSGDYRWMITPEMLEQTPGIWYIETKLFNSSWEPGFTLSITSFMSKCLYWDTDREMWSIDGCRVGEKSTPERTQCLCNHLTLFGSSFFVMPNYVDISRTGELFATVSQNYVVLALLCTFFGLYLITLMWACYADRRSRSKRKMTLLEDNHPGAQYNYLIGVQTSHRKNAGTTANVTVKLIGSDGESEMYNLTDPDKSVFERGAVDMFLLATPFPLGEVQSVRLQHDNSGGHPSWYINKMTVQDLQTRQVVQFFCGCWLSSNHGDGMTKKTFNAAKNNEIASFRNIFHSRTSTGFRDEHIWVSIVDPPSRSPFTRAQRVSCCMSLLLCTMAINIAFWNIPVDEESPVVFQLGSLKITWQEIMVGVQSGLLMFPINILIITIFRSIRPRVISNPKKDDYEENRKPPPVSIPTILKETEEMMFLVSKSPKNQISGPYRLEYTTDLSFALDRVNELMHLMQGEAESTPHWVHCSRFLLACLCHLLIDLEKLDARHFPSAEEHQYVLNITNLLVRKAEMVFSSHLTYCPPPVRKPKKKSGGCWLPWWCVFLGWFLLLSISGVSTFFTLLYGFEYGKEKSIKWVMSLGLSLFQSIFILQPLKVIGIAVFFALLLKPVAVEESEEIEQVLLGMGIGMGMGMGMGIAAAGGALKPPPPPPPPPDFLSVSTSIRSASSPWPTSGCPEREV
ncbi:hypothetical protein INR49_003105, partial [Caranx melampygus]